MEKEAFEILKNIEDTWWHFGRKEAVHQALLKVGLKHETTVLDAGAGYGGMISLLSQYGTVDGTEPETEAALICKERGYSKFFNSEVEAVQQKRTYGLIGAFDVIEHVEDDKTFVKNLCALTKEGGLLVATVPAFQFLWGEHDVKHKHFRRHTVGSMRLLLEQSGYAVVYARYWNVFLFPVALLTRLMGKSGESGLHPHVFISRILSAVVWFEARLIRYIFIPFGLSVVIVGKKK